MGTASSRDDASPLVSQPEDPIGDRLEQHWSYAPCEVAARVTPSKGIEGDGRTRVLRVNRGLLAMTACARVRRHAVGSCLGWRRGLRSHPADLPPLLRINGLVTFGILAVDWTLVLFLTAPPERGGLGWDASSAARLLGVYLAASYVAPLVGGLLADRLLGPRRSLSVGVAAAAAAHVLLAVAPALPFGEVALAAALGLAALGFGLFRPTIIALTGGLYAERPADLDASQTLLWTAQNLGAFLAAALAGGIGALFGWQAAYLVAAASLAAALRWIAQLQRTSAAIKVGQVGARLRAGPVRNWLPIVAAFAGLTLLYNIGFQQLYGSLPLFIERQVDRQVFGFEVPTPWLLALEPLLIVAVAPLAATLWQQLARRGRDFSAGAKFALGFLVLAAAFAVLAMIDALNIDGTNGLLLVVVAIALIALSEIPLAPIGIALVTRLAPAAAMGMTLGGWYAVQAAASIGSGEVGAQLDRTGAATVFAGLAIAAAATASAVALARRRIAAAVETA